MSTPTLAPGRAVSRVTTKQRLGPDAQVDDKAMVIAPADPSLTDPFLALAEDWFSEPGFEWHPHRGLETITIVLDGVLEHGDNIGNAGAVFTDPKPFHGQAQSLVLTLPPLSLLVLKPA